MKTNFWTLQDVAKLFDISPVTIERWIHQGKIPYKNRGDRYYFKRSEIRAWAREHDLILKDLSSVSVTMEHLDEKSLAAAVKRGGIHYEVEGKDIYSIFQSALSRFDFITEKYENKIHDALLKREEMASTSLGQGIAIPHSRERLDLGLEKSFVPIVFLNHDIDFHATGHKPVSCLFMMFSPDTRCHLRMLSRISLLLKDDSMLTLFKNQKSERDIMSSIIQFESGL